MKSIRMLLLTLALICFSMPAWPASAADDGYLYWGEAQSGVYQELHPNTLNWSGNVLDKGGMRLSDLRMTTRPEEADLIINQFGAIGARSLVKLNQTLQERTSSRQQGFVSSYTMQVDDLYLLVLHDGSYAKLRIDRILPSQVNFSYVLETEMAAPSSNQTQQPASLPAGQPNAESDGKTTAVSPIQPPTTQQPTTKPTGTNSTSQPISGPGGQTASSQPSSEPAATPAANPKQVTIQLTIDSPHAVINGTDFILEKAPFIVNEGTTLVPVRFVTEALGARVEWNGSEQKVTLRHSNLAIELWIDKTAALLNEKPMELEAAPILLDGVTLVPLRFVVESFNQQIHYEAATRTIRLIGYEDTSGQNHSPITNDNQEQTDISLPESAYGIWALYTDPQYQWLDESGPSARLTIRNDGTYLLQDRYTSDKKGVWRLAELVEVQDRSGHHQAILLSGAGSTADWALLPENNGRLGLYYSYLISEGGLYGGRKIGWKPEPYNLTREAEHTSDLPNTGDPQNIGNSGETSDASHFLGDWELRVQGGATFYYSRTTGNYAGFEFSPSVDVGELSVRADGTYEMDVGEKANGKWRVGQNGEVNGIEHAIILQDGPGDIDWAMTLNASGAKAVLYDSGGRWTDGSVMWIIYYVADQNE